MNYEINVLYLAFSNLTKTIKVARDSLYEGDDNLALLNYHEVAQIFDQLGNREKYGSCMNNLGCIYIKKDCFEHAVEFLKNASEIQQLIINNAKSNPSVSETDMKSFLFVNACRNYNKALACHR